MTEVIIRDVIREVPLKRSSSHGLLVATLIILSILALMFLFGNYGKQLMQFGGTSVSVPKQIDVNVNQGGGASQMEAPTATAQ